MARPTLWALLAVLQLFRTATAQTCFQGYEWANNWKGESVCELVVKAQKQFPKFVPQGDAVFTPPGDDNIGSCSGAGWLLISSCADCSGRTFYPWSTWSKNCREKWPHLPPNSGLRGFELPQWIGQFNNEFIKNDIFNRVVAGGPVDFPQQGPSENSPPPTPSPSSISRTAHSSTASPGEATPTRDEASTNSSPSDATSTGQAGSSTSRSAVDPELSAASAPTSFLSESNSRTQRSSSILTTITTTDAYGQQTVITSAMPTLVDPSNSGSGDSPEPGTTSAQSKTPNVGAIVGGVIAGLVVLVLIIVILLVLRKRRRNARIAPSTAFIRDYNREFERYEDEVARMASPRPFSPAGGRSITPSGTLPLAVDSKSQDQLLEKLNGYEQDHFRPGSVKGHGTAASLLDGRQP